MKNLSNLGENLRLISIFGSARIHENDELYDKAFALSTALSKAGFGIITGGSSGIMEAANKGAFLAGGKSVGYNVRLPNEQQPNRFCTDFRQALSLSERKIWLTKDSFGFVVMPGGFGTLDELFEILVLRQTGLNTAKIVLFGSEFWSPLISFFRDKLLKFKMIDESSLELFYVSDEPGEIVEYFLSDDGESDGADNTGDNAGEPE